MRGCSGSIVTGAAGIAARRCAALALALGIFPAGTAQAQLRDAIATPDAGPLLTLHAEGAQIYECKSDRDGKLGWTFREPIAALMLDGRTVGRHYAGPTWEHVDGSRVQGKPAGRAPGATAADIPWLKLDAAAQKGHGALSDAVTIQRVNTHGGALEGACDAAGAFRSVAYSADYVFLKK